jgi:hypothetical protein
LIVAAGPAGELLAAHPVAITVTTKTLKTSAHAILLSTVIFNGAPFRRISVLSYLD